MILYAYRMSEFMDKYLFKKPALIDGFTSNWSDTEFWSKDSLMKEYGNYVFEAGRSLELVLNAGVGKWNSTFYDYWRDSKQVHLDDETMGPFDAQFKEDLYIFDRSVWREDEDFQYRNIHGPPYLFNTDDQYGILFFGVTGTGATWHSHGEAWTGVAFGRKRWMLYPPEINPVGGFWPGYSSKDWFTNIYPHIKEHIPKDVYSWNVKQEFIDSDDEILRKYPRSNIFQRGDLNIINSDSEIADILKTDFESMNAAKKYGNLYAPIECIQGEGQLLYLPEFWWHAVVNVGDTIAFGLQTSESYTAWTQEIKYMGDLERELLDSKQKSLHKPLLTDLEKDSAHFEMMRVHERLGEYAPNNAVHQFFIGYEYFELNEFVLAEEYILDALLMDPAFIDAYVTLFKLYNAWYESERNDFYSGYYRHLAEKSLRTAYILNHNHPNVRQLLIEQFEKQNNLNLVEIVQRHQPLPSIIHFSDFEEYVLFYTKDKNITDMDNENIADDIPDISQTSKHSDL